MGSVSHVKLLFSLCGISSVLQQTAGVTLSPCGRDNTAEVIQGQSTTFTCSGLSSGVQVDWVLGANGNVFSAGTCQSVSSGGACASGVFGAATTPSRVSGTESGLVMDPTQFNDKSYVQQGTLECQESANREDSCQTDYVVKAQGSCSVQTGTGSSRYQVTGTCTMAGASSSRGRYGCDWYRTGQSSLVVSKTLTAATYETGCNVSFSLPTSDGQYSYTATLIPGRRSVTAGSIDVAKPATPALPTCDGGEYIPENTTVSCTCNTDNIGTPTGRLQWIKTGSSMTVLASGDYGRDSLTVSQRLQRADHQSTQFRCNVDWASDSLGRPVTFKVGYPPTTITIGLNPRQDDLTVNERQNVSFQCQNSDGRPDPTVALLNQDNGTALASRELHLSHSVVARCEDSGDYVCTADNGMGPAVTSVARRLLVQCSPRGQEYIGEVNFDTDPVSVSFDVTAYPVPDDFTFHYLGPSANSTGNDSVDSSRIRLAASCEAKAGVVYMSTCAVTVSNVTTATAEGFYQVTVSNTPGDGQFQLEVKYKEPEPAPNDGQSGGSNIGGIAGGVVGVIAAIAVVAVVVFVVVRRRKKDGCKEGLHNRIESPAPRSGGGRPANGRPRDYEDMDNPGFDMTSEQIPPRSLSMNPPATTPSLSSSPPPPPSGDVYAEVTKPKRAPAAAAAAGAEAGLANGTQAEELYAEVDKKKEKKQKPPPVPSAAKPAADGAKPKKGKGKRTNETAIYGNVDTKAKKKGKKPAPPPAEDMDSGRQVNPDGLIYTSVDFAGAPQPSAPPPPHAEDQGVVYSAVDFQKSGASKT